MGLTREYALLLTFLVATQVAAPPQKNAAAYGPDAEVKEFRVSALEANLQNMQPGPERDFFAGVLTNWNGRVDDSILLLNRALAGIRESQPKRAALALETLATTTPSPFDTPTRRGRTTICWHTSPISWTGVERTTTRTSCTYCKRFPHKRSGCRAPSG
jgi:hypothetical protein